MNGIQLIGMVLLWQILLQVTTKKWFVCGQDDKQHNNSKIVTDEWYMCTKKMFIWNINKVWQSCSSTCTKYIGLTSVNCESHLLHGTAEKDRQILERNTQLSDRNTCILNHDIASAHSALSVRNVIVKKITISDHHFLIIQIQFCCKCLFSS